MELSKEQEWSRHLFGRDTDPDGEAVLVAAIRRQPLAVRAASVVTTGRALAHFSMAGARMRHPGAPATALAYDLDRRRYGPALAGALEHWRADQHIAPEVDRYMAADPFPLLYTVVDALDAAGVDYLVTGSLAGGIYGTPRATNDVDLLARLTPAAVTAFLRSLPATLYADPETIADAVRRRSSFNIIDAVAGAKVDIFVSDESPWARAQFERVQILTLGPRARPLSLVSAEDIVLAKLLWYRAGGEVSEQQWRDVTGILTITGPDLDRVWLEHWAARLGVRDLLDRLEPALPRQDVGSPDQLL